MTATAVMATDVSVSADQDDDLQHIVCHCTDDTVAACRKDVADEPWTDLPDDKTCALCRLAWPIDAASCPWGCSCAEECGPEETQ